MTEELRVLGFATGVDQVKRYGFASCHTRVGFSVEQVKRWGFASCRTRWATGVDQVKR
jgi:hypothetical protein